MRAGDSYLAEIARLRAENEELRERLRYYEELFSPVSEPFPRAWWLCGAHKRMLVLFLRSAPKLVSRAALHAAASGKTDPESQEQVVDSQMARLRRKLARYCPDARIKTVYGEGFSMSAASKAAILDAIAADPPPSAAPYRTVRHAVRTGDCACERLAREQGRGAS